MQIRPRSGLALKNGITVINSPGTIDSDYRGETGILLVNLSNENFEINNGDRIYIKSPTDIFRQSTKLDNKVYQIM